MRYQGYTPNWAEWLVWSARLRTIQGLLAMRRAGELHAVWCDDFKLSLQYSASGGRVRISWKDAESMVLEFERNGGKAYAG